LKTRIEHKMLALKIILIVVGVIGLLAVVAVAWFIRTIRWAIKAEMDCPGCPPCRVNPEPESNPQWRNSTVIRRYAEEFESLGFKEVGAFSLPELSGLLILAFVHPTEHLYGVIYDHKTIEPTFDICCAFEDGSGLSATNTSMGNTLDKRPDHALLWVGKETVREVLEAAQKHPQPAARKPVAREGFVAYFKKDYAEGMNWRLKKGGINREEIRRQAQQDGQQLSEEQLEESYKSLRESYLRELGAGCMAQYLDAGQPAVAEWEPLRERAFAIPETLSAEEIVETINNVRPLDEEQQHVLAKVQPAFGETAVDLMEKILAQNIGTLGLVKLGEVREPVQALILLAPAESNGAPYGK
jgi:hypothetical protein